MDAKEEAPDTSACRLNDKVLDEDVEQDPGSDPDSGKGEENVELSSVTLDENSSGEGLDRPRSPEVPAVTAPTLPGRVAESPTSNTDDAGQTCDVKASSSSSSSGSSTCRICQGTEKETGESMGDIGCACRGSVRKCHQDCLARWVRMRRSTECELCREHFTCLTAELLRELDPPDELHQLAPPIHVENGFTRRVGCGDSRRTWYGVITSLLTFVTCAAGALAIYIQDDYSRAWREARKRGESGDDVVNSFHMSYGLVLSVLAFCGTLLVGVALIWALSELYLWPRERYRRREWRALDTARENLARRRGYMPRIVLTQQAA